MSGAPARRGLGTASAVVGVASLLLALVVPLALAGGLAGLVLALAGRRRLLAGEADDGRAVLVGLVTSGVAVLLLVALVAAGAWFALHPPAGD